MVALKPYTRALRRLAQAQAPFALIGTASLAIRFPAHMHSYPLLDADIVVPPDLDAIRQVATLLRKQGWTLSVWEASLPTEFELGDVEGKYYIRARLGALTLDITHECPIPWSEMAPSITWHQRLPLASLSHTLHLKRLKGSPKDMETLGKVARWIAHMKDMRP